MPLDAHTVTVAGGICLTCCFCIVKCDQLLALAACLPDGYDAPHLWVHSRAPRRLIQHSARLDTLAQGPCQGHAVGDMHEKHNRLPMGWWPRENPSQATEDFECALLPAGPAGSAHTWSVWLLYPRAGHSWSAGRYGRKGQEPTGMRWWPLVRLTYHLTPQMW